ncbi:hypothetical protein [Nocardia fluminea]|uniref:Uncharacterized protein n=1 Tax=Nocardia fluminea TaxID=134984 RepID=A0A2N3VGX1_9NOCA|nr:hypothetical protein [Nocardia fluminea]PKV80879.1 hypothetical protein ATK86_5316 [Nocardia fluminea]
MSMKYVRDYYAVPAKRGRRVRYTGEGEPRLGTITSARQGGLRIRLDGDKRSLPFHPTWELEYLTEEKTDA